MLKTLIRKLLTLTAVFYGGMVAHRIIWRYNEIRSEPIGSILSKDQVWEEIQRREMAFITTNIRDYIERNTY